MLLSVGPDKGKPEEADVSRDRGSYFLEVGLSCKNAFRDQSKQE